MRAGPSPARTLFTVTAVIWLVLELRQARQTRPDATVADGGSRAIVRCSYLVGAVAAAVARHLVPSADMGTGDGPLWIGLGALWCGVGLRFWSFQTLGRYFTFTVQTSPDQPVISAGPYRILRHPGYAGVLLAVVGVGFAIGNWTSLVLLTVSVACGLVYRITIEERALTRELGDRYRSYASGRKRLIPFVW